VAQTEESSQENEMTTYFQTTNSTTGATPFTANGDTYNLFEGVTVGSSGFGIYTNSYSGTLNIQGNIIASSGAIALYSTGSNYVNIGNTAQVFGGLNSIAIEVDGIHGISNAGSIVGFGGNAVGILTNGSGFILNSGQITSGTYGIYNSSLVSTDTVKLFNSGSITAIDYAYFGFDSIDQITNSGAMTGNVSTGGGADRIINYGHIYGNINMGADSDTLYTDMSALGPYTIQGGAGSDLLVNIDNNHTAAFNMADIGFETYYGGSQASYAFGGTATFGLTFVGGVASDAFIGGTGNDVAAGGAGGDYLDGGAATAIRQLRLTSIWLLAQLRVAMLRMISF
jgi:hypothetical protein